MMRVMGFALIAIVFATSTGCQTVWTQNKIRAEICCGPTFDYAKDYLFYVKTGVAVEGDDVECALDRIMKQHGDEYNGTMAGIDMVVVFEESGEARFLCTIYSFGAGMDVRRLKKVRKVPGGYMVFKPFENDGDPISFEDQAIAGLFRESFRKALEDEGNRVLQLWTGNHMGVSNCFVEESLRGQGIRKRSDSVLKRERAK